MGKIYEINYKGNNYRRQKDLHFEIESTAFTEVLSLIRKALEMVQGRDKEENPRLEKIRKLKA